MNATFKKITLGSATAVGALALVVGAPLAAQAADTWTTAKADVVETEAVEASSNVWEVELVGHNHANDAEFDPESVIYEVAYEDGEGYISGTEGDTPLWLGFGVGESTDFLSDIVNGEITYTLTDATGTGDVTVSKGSTIDLDFDASSYSGSQSFSIDEHAHPEWSFSEPGTYTLTFEASVTPKSGVSVSYPEGDEVTITFDVVE